VTRYGSRYVPDATFLGIDRCDLSDPMSFAGADVVVIGAPFDAGTSHGPGTRFGPQAIRMTDYLPHDGSRPRLALRTDGLRDLRVLDAGDLEFGRCGGTPPMRRLIESEATGSCRSGCAATGRVRRRWTGWRTSGCAPTR
jgi:arginase family enzyme